MILKVNEIKKYFQRIFPDKRVEVKEISKISGETVKEDIKGYGYGEPLLITVTIDQQEKKFVLSTVKPGGFGHDFFYDRAKILLFAHSSYNKLPRHVRSIDVGTFLKDGSLVPLGEAEEFFLIMEYAEGEEYFRDLERIRESDELSELDLKRAEALSNYLVEIHSVKKSSPDLYIRRIRELLGDGEQIMGLIDSYDPKADFLEEGELIRIEKKCVEWRWKLKNKTHRLCQVHGDFHPWNVKFRKDIDFTVLDRSRGEWGEAADDVSCMAINYLFFSIQKYGELKGPFEKLWKTLIENYLEKTGDDEVMEVIQPFFAWRGLVIASPIWYPTMSPEIRRRIFNFINNVLETDIFDYKAVNSYLK